MAYIASFNELLVSQMRDLYDAEKRLTKAIPKLGKAATNRSLRAALNAHLGETEKHVTRLEKAFDSLGETPKAKPCAGMRGIIDEGDEHVSEDYDDAALRDAVIIGSAQRVEHYEIAAYGTAIAHARLLGHQDVAKLMEASLAEEKAANRKLTEIAEGDVNIGAVEASHEEQPARMYRSRAGRQERSTAQSRSRRGKKTARGRKSARKIRR